MTIPHPQTQKAQLRRLLATDQVVTAAQLERWGLLAAARHLGLPTLIRTCRTRVTQAHSDADLEFVALSPEPLGDLASRELMHLCGLAEVRRLRAFQPGEAWRHVQVQGRSKSPLPDAEIVQTLDPTFRLDWAVEFDAGYSPKRISAKLRAAAAGGYGGMLWASSIHARTVSVLTLTRRLAMRGELRGLTQVETMFVDFWSPHDPYANRPRCHKPMGQQIELGATTSANKRW